MRRYNPGKCSTNKEIKIMKNANIIKTDYTNNIHRSNLEQEQHYNFDENSKRIAYPPNGDGNTEQTPVMPLELSTKK